MNIIQKHIEYLKDNPGGYWFKRKLYGWGWTPATKEGWLVTTVAVAAVLVIALRAEEFQGFETTFKQGILPIIAIIILLLIICYRTGEKPKWQWGEPVRGTGARLEESISEHSD